LETALRQRREAMKLSARNLLKGKVLDVKEGQIMAKVKVDLGGGNIVSSLISVEAVKDLDVKVGDEIGVLIKATSVMLAK
jgi:molybdopterin-binding protein